MRDLHLMIVNNDCQMIRGESVRLENHLVIDILRLELHMTTNEVVPAYHFVIRNLHANHVTFSTVYSFLCFIFGKRPASAIVMRNLALLLLSFSHLIQTLGRTKTIIGMVLLNQCFNMLFI